MPATASAEAAIAKHFPGFQFREGGADAGADVAVGGIVGFLPLHQ